MNTASHQLCAKRQESLPREEGQTWSDLLHYGCARVKKKKINSRSKSMIEWKALEDISIEIPSRRSSASTPTAYSQNTLSSSTLPGSSINSNAQLAQSWLQALTARPDSTVTSIDPCKPYDSHLFLVRFSKALLESGAPSHRLDHCVKLLMKKLGTTAQFGYFPGFLVVSFGEPDTLTASMQLIRVDSGLDLDRLTRIYQLFESILCDDIRVDEAVLALDSITKAPPLYPAWLTLFAYAIASGSSTSLFFSGGLVDMALGSLLGLIVAVGSLYMSRHITRFTSIFDVFLSAVLGFLAATATARLPSNSSCFYALSIGGVVNLLPGYATLVSVLEIAAGSVASGTLRLTHTLVYSLLIGFGLAIGASTHQLLFPSLALVSSDAVCDNTIPLIYHLALVPLFVVANAIMLRGHPSKYFIILLLASLSHGVHFVALQHFVAYPHLATVIAAFVVATASNLYARLIPTVGFVDMITGLFFLVPGSVGVSSSFDTFGQALASSTPMTEMSVILNAGQQGIVFAAHMMVITVSVSLGLVLAAVFIYPLRKLLDCKRRHPQRYRRKNWVGEITF